MQSWGRNLTAYLRRTADRLRFRQSGDTAAQNGIILWDNALQAPVVSSSGVWRQIVIADGYARLERTTSQTAALADTAYAIQYGTPSLADGISLDGSDPTRIVFGDGGIFLLSFTAQINSTSASTVDFRFWPRINGADVSGSAILAKLHQNGASTVVARTMLFSVSAGDYLQAMWATSSTSGSLLAAGSTAFAPSAPASTLSIERMRAT
jgi:hypothetical protein